MCRVDRVDSERQWVPNQMTLWIAIEGAILNKHPHRLRTCLTARNGWTLVYDRIACTFKNPTKINDTWIRFMTG